MLIIIISIAHEQFQAIKASRSGMLLRGILLTLGSMASNVLEDHSRSENSLHDGEKIAGPCGLQGRHSGGRALITLDPIETAGLPLEVETQMVEPGSNDLFLAPLATAMGATVAAAAGHG